MAVREPTGQAVVVDGCDTVSRLFWKRVTGRPDKVALREKEMSAV